VQQQKTFTGGQLSSEQAEFGLGGATAAGRERDWVMNQYERLSQKQQVRP
jgi:hypothetical protein